jgi:hypothetical protein
MTTAEARALIADGKKHDEAIRSEQPTTCRCIDPNFAEVFGPHVSAECPIRQWRAKQEDAVEWRDKNWSNLITGYASALDEAERHAAAREQDTREALVENDQLREQLVTARTSIGELKLVIEQQDRDMERMRMLLDEACRGWRTNHICEVDCSDDELRRIDEIEKLLPLTGAPCKETTK